MKFYVYLIKNIINNAIYVGHTDNIKRRFGEHKRKSFRKTRMYSILYRSIEKYGLNNFTFDVLEEFDNVSNIESLDAEEFFINYFKFLGMKIMNIHNGGQKSSLGFKHSVETKLKLSQIQIGKKLTNEHKQNIGKGNKGKIISLETRLKMKIALSGRKVGKQSEQALLKNTLAHKKIFNENHGSIVIVNKITGHIQLFEETNDVISYLNIHRRTFYRYLNGSRKHKQYYIYYEK